MTSKVTAWSSPRFTEPSFDKPPRRKRVPGCTCLAATSAGALKKTMVSVMA